MNSTETIQGSIERVTFHSEDTGYSVIKIKAKNHKDLVTIVGHVSSVNAGEYVEAEGEWIQHRDFGAQFKADTIKMVPPSTLEGLEKYLGSGMIKGIGPHFAEKLVKSFGFEVFDIIEKSPLKLKKISGIGPSRIEKITNAWKDQKVVRDIMVFLQSHGVSTSKAVRIYKTYGESAVAKVTDNPYRLARDIHGIGFKSADLIAANLGVKKDSPLRARAGIQHVLSEKMSAGHCAYPIQALKEETAELLQMDINLLDEAVNSEIKDEFLVKEIIEGEECVYSWDIYQQESEVASLLAGFLEGKLPWADIQVDKAIEWVGSKLHIVLAPLQRQAVSEALKSKVIVITGGPGTGKTTLTKAILEILKAKKVNLSLCSPTGRAAKRLTECTGIEAKTIHRLLGIDRKTGGFLHHEDNLLTTDLLLIDEASMVDISLMQKLLKALPKTAGLIVVGDVDQLPSVGPGSVLSSLIESKVIPVVKLTEVFRQAANSAIIVNAHQINEGILPDFSPKGTESDFHFIEASDPKIILSKIIELVKFRIPNYLKVDPVKDIQVLCPMNRGNLGARTLNTELQLVLNFNPLAKVEKYGTTFAVNDKVMVTSNDYDKEVFNGDIGFIKNIDLSEQNLTVDIDGREVQFEFSELDILALAYAISVHKSQGSEYPVIILPISMQHFVMLKRNLLYTGVTRGKRMVILIGEKKAVETALLTRNQGKRWNKLSDRIADSFKNIRK